MEWLSGIALKYFIARLASVGITAWKSWKTLTPAPQHLSPKLHD